MKPSNAVYIPNLLQAPEKTKEVEIETHYPELETLTPVRGTITMTHNGNYLNVRGQAVAIITLTCHRCLQNYNHRLSVSPQEMIWLEERAGEAYPLEREVAVEDLVETVPPDGYFYPEDWLYQQLCLALPQQQLCDAGCEGIPQQQTENEAVDRRWAALAQLKAHLPEDSAQ